MRKTLSILAAFLVFLFAGTEPLHIYAANELIFAVDFHGTVTKGETITVPINVSNNPGFSIVGLIVTYNPDVLEITGVTAPVAEMPLNSQFALTTTPGTQWISLVNTNLRDWNGNGTVANITFIVKSTATIGTSNIALAFTSSPNGTPTNANGDILANTEVFASSVSIVADNSNVVNSGDGSYESNSSSNSDWDSSANTPTPTQTETPSQSAQTPNGSTDVEVTDSGNSSSYHQDSSNIYNNSDSLAESGSGDETIDDGRFIGTPYTVDETGADMNEADKTVTNVDTSTFGKVPQTGVYDIMGTVIAMCVCFFASIGLFIYILHILRRKHRSCDNG